MKRDRRDLREMTDIIDDEDDDDDVDSDSELVEFSPSSDCNDSKLGESVIYSSWKEKFCLEEDQSDEIGFLFLYFIEMAISVLC